MKLLLILLLASPLWASGPRYSYSDPRLNDEMANIYKDIVYLPKFPNTYTKAQIGALAVKRPGTLFYCSDCTNDVICVSTGILVGQSSRLTAKGTACQ